MPGLPPANLCPACFPLISRVAHAAPQASHVTYNDVRAPENPCFFCDICFGPLHYTAEGVRRHHFEHYEYRHEE